MTSPNARNRAGARARWKTFLWSTGLALLLGAGGLWVILWAPNSFEGDRIITVSKGDSFRAIEDTLVTAGVIRNRLLFNLAARVLGSTRRMQIGRYRFRSGMSNSRILEDLEFGKSVELVTVTIPEGTRARRVALLFARNLGLDTALFLGLVRDSNFARSAGIDAPSLEGYLLPNTYRFYWQEAEETVLTAMTAEFRKFWTDSLAALAVRRHLTMHEVVTLASIIEAETRVDTERAIISGVYHNRLRKRMRLQADPTVQYILEDGPRRLSYSDLHRPSPYNTYRNAGLPPGPVNNPGMASILAALSPRAHRYYFFVANGEGGHSFSVTYAEHLRQVRAYQRKRAQAARAAAMLDSLGAGGVPPALPGAAGGRPDSGRARGADTSWPSDSTRIPDTTRTGRPGGGGEEDDAR